MFNNKGKPVRQYEPFFTATPGFEFARADGVSPVLFYDPAGRVVATLQPGRQLRQDHLRPWHQDAWDAADTVLLDPRDDPDVRGYVGPLPCRAEPGSPAAGRPGTPAGSAAGSAGPRSGRPSRRPPHAGTPTRSWLDTLGRTFLTVAHNRVPEDGRLVDQFCRTHSLLDIQGNEHEVRDALGRAVMRYGFAMLGGQVSHAGMDTGGGNGAARRHWASRSTPGTPAGSRCGPSTTRCADRCAPTWRGRGSPARRCRAAPSTASSLPDPEARNLRTRVARQFDGAGIAVSPAYDFKGNLLALDPATRRRVRRRRPRLGLGRAA